MIGSSIFLCNAQQINPARDLVNPFIGTGGHGHTFPGACVPNGLVQLSPDTRPDGYMDWDGCGGYHYSDRVIHGFSHTHLSGTGVADLCDVLVMPMSGAASTDPTVYRSTFQHKNEAAHAGYYRVWLEEEKTLAELTATARCGVHRYTMPSDKDQFLVLDLGHRDKVLNASIRQEGGDIVGERRSSSWARDQRLFFCIRIGRAGSPVDFDLKSTDSTKAIIQLKGSGSGAVVVKVGISGVSIEGARKNLDVEVPHWDFDQVRQQAEDAWNAKLNKIAVEGGTRTQQRIFHTALYHCYVAPYVFNDVDGHYRGLDGVIHHADHDVYTVFSLWDTFRALHPLMTILEPEMTSDWIKTFLLHYQQGGRLPVWELWGNETDCMIGYHSASVIADAHLKGIRGFDGRLALKALMDGARLDHFGLKAYQDRGFMSSEDGAESVSRTLEYAYDDACIAAFAARLENGGGDDGRLDFRTRSGSWRHLFDRSAGFFRARRNGGFAPGFDPYEVNFNFTEANAWQYSLFVPQDIDGLIASHGGPEKFEAHLDKLFAANTATSGREQADITGLIGQYAHGNEPSHHMAYLYNRIGRPEKTRALVKHIMDELYHDAPDGLSGNEDCGQMSAWYVLSGMGFYPVSPGIDDRYELGYPLFEACTINLSNGNTWNMRVGDDRAWKASLPRDTANYRGEVPDHLSHAEIVEGGRLHLNGDRSPQRRYTMRDGMLRVLDGAHIPASGNWTGAPVIEAHQATFLQELVVTVHGRGTCRVITGDSTWTCPMNAPFTLLASAEVRVDWSAVYAPIVARFTQLDGSRTIQLESAYANQYSAGGDNALIDGLRGGPDFRTGEWQGYEGQDLVAMVDLGEVKKLERLGLSILQDQKSWIFAPVEVIISWSTNKRQWSSRTITPGLDPRIEGVSTHEVWADQVAGKARYVSVVAKSIGPCPEWHVGKGGKTWIFADEILIDVE
ncbi:MAG: GH92 family glycosyl hydrolase [Flavobacteriales bacterium]